MPDLMPWDKDALDTALDHLDRARHLLVYERQLAKRLEVASLRLAHTQLVLAGDCLQRLTRAEERKLHD